MISILASGTSCPGYNSQCCHNFSSGGTRYELVNLFDVAIKQLLAFFRFEHSPINAFLRKPTCVRCKGTARMYSYRRVKVLTA